MSGRPSPASALATDRACAQRGYGPGAIRARNYYTADSFGTLTSAEGNPYWPWRVDPASVHRRFMTDLLRAAFPAFGRRMRDGARAPSLRLFEKRKACAWAENPHAFFAAIGAAVDDPTTCLRDEQRVKRPLGTYVSQGVAVIRALFGADDPATALRPMFTSAAEVTGVAAAVGYLVSFSFRLFHIAPCERLHALLDIPMLLLYDARGSAHFEIVWRSLARDGVPQPSTRMAVTSIKQFARHSSVADASAAQEAADAHDDSGDDSDVIDDDDDGPAARSAPLRREHLRGADC